MPYIIINQGETEHDSNAGVSLRLHGAVENIFPSAVDGLLGITYGLSCYTRAMVPYGELLPISLDPDPVIEAYKKDVDITLLRENLKLTPSERIEKMISALRFAEAVQNSEVKADAK